MDVPSELYNGPLPPWVGDVKNETREKIAGAAFSEACRRGDQEVMRGLVVGLWPFINEFPKSMIRSAARLPPMDLLRKRALVNYLLYRGGDIIKSIREDEENHRELWLETGAALGLRFPDDYTQPVPHETQAWIDALNREATPSTSLVQFAAVEIIAEAVSVELVRHEAFTSTLGGQGSQWFRVHAEHGSAITHEELEFRLAFALNPEGPMMDKGDLVVRQIADLSVAAMEAAAKITRWSDSILPSK